MRLYLSTNPSFIGVASILQNQNCEGLKNVWKYWMENFGNNENCMHKKKDRNEHCFRCSFETGPSRPSTSPPHYFNLMWSKKQRHTSLSQTMQATTPQFGKLPKKYRQSNWLLPMKIITNGTDHHQSTKKKPFLSSTKKKNQKASTFGRKLCD